jgi:UDP-N-acetylglucosamine/UDP-N-acetylgalactosamine diphosphorylase
MDLDMLESKLSMYGQKHLIQYTDKLSEAERIDYVEQLRQINFTLILSEQGKQSAGGVISPIPVLQLEDIREDMHYYTDLGLDAIRKGKLGLVLLAGGQGSRLGYDKPKGMLNVGVEREWFLFQILLEHIQSVVRAAGTYIHLFIMTSDLNDQDTRTFFQEHQFFGYHPDYIHFYVQGALPAVDFEGRIVMADYGKIPFQSDGNGGWYHSLLDAGLGSVIAGSGIEWMNVFAVDNVLQHIADPCFLGAVLDRQVECGAKVVKKARPEERVGLICQKNKRPAIIEYYELDEQLANQKDENGNLAFNYGVILNYLFHVKALNRIRLEDLPLHRVARKVNYMDRLGKQNIPTEPNAYKLERLLLDMIALMDSCLPFEVERKKEFAPIKNLTGVDSLESARSLLQKNGYSL